MKQLWHKAKALFGFGPQEAETPPPTAEDIAEGWNSLSMAQARAALALPPAGDSLNRLAVMAQPVVTEDTYRHRTDWSTRD